MGRKILEKFYEEEFMPLIKKNNVEVNKRLWSESEKLWLGIKKELQEAFEKIYEMQQKQEMEPVAYIQLVLLRSRCLSKDCRYAMMVYGKDWYLGKEYHVGDLNAEFVLGMFPQMQLQLEKASRKYIGKISQTDVERLLLEETGRSVYYVHTLLRIWRDELLDLAEYEKVEKEDRIRIEVGEYYEPGIPLYYKDKGKSEKEMRRRLRKKAVHTGMDFSGMSFDGQSLSGHQYENTNFSQTTFRNAEIKKCNAMGAMFHGTVMINAYLYRNILQGSVWKGCDLRDTTFEECIMYRGTKEEEGNLLPDSQSMVLEDCQLKGTTFKRCIMNGMDFTKTDIRECVFEECGLEGCSFPAGQENCLDISEDQKETIHWV
ncbi:MAG: pentapeptide repeat-containing protein [Clostridiales bacterium]|nr:pentapeptide repeat-containing protein [Clostridiales bacterium]